MVQIIEMLIPASNKRTRPGIKMTPKYITIHETDNTNVRANALAHARLQYNGNARTASWHLQVDDEKEVYQSLPFNEIGLHAGDGKGQGNRASIGIEICVNQDGNYKTAVANAIKVVKYLLKQYPSITHVEVVQHNKWSGKNCPRHLRAGDWGINWSQFIAGVRGATSSATKPTTPPKYETTNTSFKIGSKVRVKKSAKTYATGQPIADFVKGTTYTVMQRGSNRMLLKEIMSWVRTSDLELVSGSSGTPSKPTNSNTQGSSPKATVGAKVTLKTSATHYATGEPIPASVKGKTYTIQQVGSGRVLLKEIYSWVKNADVGIGGSSSGSSSGTSSSSKKAKVGQTVTLSKSATRFATGEPILSSAKGKKYKILQVKSDRVLLDKIMSWVLLKDVGLDSASTSSAKKSNKASTPTFKVGSKVKIKNSAKTYSRANAAIPARFKNKSYTIQQVGANDVLLKELYSWVRKSDVQ